MNPVAGVLLIGAISLLAACTRSEPTASAAPSPRYSMEDFKNVRKLDSHVHMNVQGTAFLEQAREDGFELVSINVDYSDFPSLAEQRAATLAQLKAQESYKPARVHWATTFSMQGFDQSGWADRVKAGIAEDVAQGAKAVKIWKNVGMSERDANGQLIMLDNPAISPVADHIEKLGITLIGHLGEPHNCWLPIEQMTTRNDREYFRAHPQYHMHLHPEMPSYEDQIGARDRFVAAHPNLRFVGAHLGSLEYDVDRIAAFLDRFPGASVDMAERLGQVQYQSVRDYDKVRNFFIKYQDRLLYATDLTLNPADDPEEFKREAHARWTRDWRYLATDETQRIDLIDADVPGLALPREVIDKVYYQNAVRAFALASPAS